MTLDEAAALEAACRGLEATGTGRRFNADTFNAVASFQLEKLRKEIQPNNTGGSE